MAEIDVDLSAPGFKDDHQDVVEKFRQILGPVKVVPISAATVFDPDAHGSAMLRLDDGAGEVLITIPASAGVGHTFGVASPAGAWPRVEVDGGGELVHAYGHTRGVPKGLISLLVVANEASTPIVMLSGATQP